jgi:ubiquinone/menaquinone biosynthesis C-methylase UbiE
MINIARRILEGKKPFHTAREGSRLDVDPRNINYVNGDVQNLDLSDGLADVLLCVNVLDRVGNTRLAMSELIRVTRAKGVLIVISAFDYEDVTTQVDEKISVGQMVDYFAANGCQLIRDNEDTLSKRLYPSGDVKIYNERCLIFQKM